MLQSSYWCGSKPTKSEMYESRKGEEDKHFEREPTDFEACIRICNLTKVSANTDIIKILWEHYLSFLFSIVHSLSLIPHSFLPFLFIFVSFFFRIIFFTLFLITLCSSKTHSECSSKTMRQKTKNNMHDVFDQMYVCTRVYIRNNFNLLTTRNS